jgi:hypothetical protein
MTQGCQVSEIPNKLIHLFISLAHQLDDDDEYSIKKESSSCGVVESYFNSDYIAIWGRSIFCGFIQITIKGRGEG